MCIISLCKRDKGKWLSAFKRDAELLTIPPLVSAEEHDHNSNRLRGPAPPPIPRAHKPSPRTVPLSDLTVKAPEVSPPESDNQSASETSSGGWSSQVANQT